MVIFPRYYAESYLITAIFKVRSQQLQATLTAEFWKAPDSWRFYRHGSSYVLIFFVPIILTQMLRKVPANYHLQNYQIWSSVDWIIFAKHYILFYHLIIVYWSRDLEVQLVKNKQKLWGGSMFFFQGLQFLFFTVQNVLITFLFSIKCCLVMPKITPDVNNNLWSYREKSRWFFAC